jgi:tetratricopeptide (TPR) repeat protein
MNNLEKKHPGLIAAVTITLAEILRLQRKFSRIEELLTSARELLHQSGEESGEDHAICIHNLGAYYRDTKKYDEAERCYNEALEILKRESPPNFRLLASAFDSQATLFLETNRPSEAQAARAMAEHARRHQESLSG